MCMPNHGLVTKDAVTGQFVKLTLCDVKRSYSLDGNYYIIINYGKFKKKNDILKKGRRNGS